MQIESHVLAHPYGQVVGLFFWKIEGFRRMLWKWGILAKNTSTLMLLLIITLCLWERSGSQQGKEIEIFHKTVKNLSYRLFVRKTDTSSTCTHVDSICRNGEAVGEGREGINSFLVECFLKRNGNRVYGDDFGVTPLLAAVVPLGNCLWGGVHASQHWKLSIHLSFFFLFFRIHISYTYIWWE